MSFLSPHKLMLTGAVLIAIISSVTSLNLVSGNSGVAAVVTKTSSLNDRTSNLTVSQFIDQNIVPDNIRENLRFLSQKPHLAGTVAETENANWVADQWRQFGLDEVNMANYQVLLSYPDKEMPNIVGLVDSSSGATVHQSSAKQEPLWAPEEQRDDVPYSFNAYSATGAAQGSLVYANYGQGQDFEVLEAAGVNCSGKIVIARYGKIFRGNIVEAAESRGALAVLLYTDPADYAVLGTDAVYPDTVMMPPTGTQQGTVKVMDGDPLTPFYPSVESAYHVPVSEAAIPKIPVQPLSYGDAYYFLSALGGDEAPLDWQGGLNISYRFGPTVPEYSVTVDVNTSNQPATIHNVIGVIRGSEEPDRYVLVGNHRDAWIFGAIDPSSGTAAMMEVARVLMQLHNETGWRPRRTLMFVSWAAEEYGLIGSVEWTEQFTKQLEHRAVAYLNADLAILGNYSFKAQAVPLLYDLIYKATKLVSNPDVAEAMAGRATVFDTWLDRDPDPEDPSQPRMLLLGSASDYKGFLHNIGVPSLDICYNHDQSIPGWYPLYHSLYETFSLVSELYDQDFEFHAAVTNVWAQMAVILTDQKVLPYSLDRYSSFITTVQQTILADYGVLMTRNNRTFDHFIRAGETFAGEVAAFQAGLAVLDEQDVLAVRGANDRQMLVERSFIDHRGLPGRPDYNHVVFAPSDKDSYTGTAFSGLTDALWVLKNQKPEDPDEVLMLWRSLDQHLAATTHLLQTAGAVLTNDLW